MKKALLLATFVVVSLCRAADLHVGSSTLNWDVTQIEDASGSAHRKVSLAGRPMPDKSPAATADTDVRPNYPAHIDAFTRRLNYSVADIEVPLPGGELSLSVRRTLSPEIWSLRHGISPERRRDRPFGLGWRSNVCVTIEFVRAKQNGVNGAVNHAYVTDEQGITHRFLVLMNPSKGEEYLPLPSTVMEQESYLYTLRRVGGTWILRKPHGTEVTYEPTTGNLIEPLDDRFIDGIAISTTYNWARATSVRDRFANQLTYKYIGANDLIPTSIGASTGQSISITAEEGRVTAIRDPRWNLYQYSYATELVDIGPETQLVADARQNFPPNSDYAIDRRHTTLRYVTSPRPGVTSYLWTIERESDLSPVHRWKRQRPTEYYHCDLATIKDARGTSYHFWYGWDHSREVMISNVVPYPITGLPRPLARVVLPGISTPVLLTAAYKLQLQGQETQGQAPTFNGDKAVTNSDAMGHKTVYRFQLPSVQQISAFWNNTFIDPIYWQHRAPYLVMFQRLVIEHPIQRTERFVFDPDASLNLVSATDFFNHTTRFVYGDAWSVYIPHPWLSGELAGRNGVTVYPFGRYPQVTKQTNAADGVRQFTYENTYRLPLTITDEDGRVTTFKRDGFGRVEFETVQKSAGGPVERRIDYEYKNGKYLAFVTKRTVARVASDPAWCVPQVTAYVPDAHGRIASETIDPDGLNIVTRYEYDAKNNRTKMTDPLNRTTLYHYDAENNLLTIRYQDQSTKQFAYDLNGNRIRETDERQKTTKYIFDRFNRLVVKRRLMTSQMDDNDEVDLIASYTYNAVGSLLTTTGPERNVVTNTYDQIQRLSTSARFGRPATKFSYGENTGSLTFEGNVFKPRVVTDPRGYQTLTIYDVLGRARVVYRQHRAPGDIDPAAGNLLEKAVRTTYVYDGAGNMRQMTEDLSPTRHPTTQFEYDGLQRQVKTILPGGASRTTQYTATGLRWRDVDENTHATITQYDAAGRPLKVTRPTVNGVPCVTKNSYDDAGNLLTSTDARDHLWTYEYNSRNRRTAEIGPAVYDLLTNTSVRPKTSFTYDAVGNRTSVTDPRLRVTKTLYDAANRPTKIIHPPLPLPLVAGKVPEISTRMAYDRNGNVRLLVNPRNVRTANTYNDFNKLRTSTVNVDGVALTVTRAYDHAGNDWWVKDGKNNKTTFAHDGFGRLLTTMDAAEKRVTQTYDGSRRVQRVDAEGRTTAFEYDERDRLKEVRYAGAAANNVSYTYDAIGNLLTAQHAGDARLNVTYTYDALNRVETELSGGVKHTYGYDANGNRNSVQYGGTGRFVESAYDALNRLRRVTEGPRTYSYFYDLNGNNVRKELPNDEVVTQAYDEWNRLRSISGPGYLIQQTYDLAGNVTGVTEEYAADSTFNRSKAFKYDNADRLTTETTTTAMSVETLTYTYDRANNRTRLVEVVAPRASGG